jgi:hypothetical protein
MSIIDIFIAYWMLFAIIVGLSYFNEYISESNILTWSVFIVLVLVIVSPYILVYTNDPNKLYIAIKPDNFLDKATKDIFFQRVREITGFYVDVIYCVSWFSGAIGVLGIIRTKAWQKKRFWLYALVNLWLCYPDLKCDYVFGYALAELVLPVGWVTIVELPWLVFGNKQRETSRKQVCSVLLCLPLVHIVWIYLLNELFRHC